MNKTILFKSVLTAFIATTAFSNMNAQRTYPTKDFVAYSTYTDPKDSTTFEIGRFEPATLRIIKNQESNLHTYQANANTHEHDKKMYDGRNATAYLKKNRTNTPPVFALNVYSNIGEIKFSDIKSEKLLILHDRYAFYAYNKKEDKISPRITPALANIKAQDLQSGSITALTLFHNDTFIIGNAQNSGVFAYNLENIESPIPLVVYNKNKKDSYIALLLLRKDGMYDIITALVDTSLDSKNAKISSNKFKNIQFAAQGQTIELKNDGSPSVSVSGNQLILNNNPKTSIDLKTGKAKF